MRHFTRYLQLLPAWVALGAFFLGPMLLMLAVSFAHRGTHGGWAFSRALPVTENYREAAEPLYVGVFWRSLWLAVVTTVLCLVVSYPLAYFIALVTKPRWKNALLMLVAIPFWTSFLIRTYAWVLIFRTEGLLNTLLLKLHLIHEPLLLLPSWLAILVGLVYGELPFMVLPLYASLEKVDRSLLEAAGDLGAGGWGTFWRVTVPLTMPGILAGTVLVFIPAIGQFIVTDVLGEGKLELIGNVIYDQFLTSANNWPLGSALSFSLTAVVLGMLTVYALYAKAGGRKKELI